MSPLVYDIGLHDGGDTGHYLEEGARVVAVDANPVMCAAAEIRFRDYIQTGQLTILNRGIAADRGQLQFWVCESVSEWSSFHIDIASRNGAPHHAISVECTTIKDIVDDFGVADYMKIDIEGNDTICINGLTDVTAPRYISIEMAHSGGDRDIERLYELSYREFKIIRQDDFWYQVTAENMSFCDPIIRGTSSGLLQWKIAPERVKKRWRGFRSKLSGRKIGESGPWGENTSGAWHSVEHAYSVWRFLHELDERLGTQGLGGWYDIHARKQRI